MDHHRTRTVIVKLREEIQTLRLCHERVEKEKEEFLSATGEAKLIRWRVNPKYEIDVYFCFSKDDHIRFLTESYGVDTNHTTESTKEKPVTKRIYFSPILVLANNSCTEKVMAFVDRIEYYLKFLNNNTELSIPATLRNDGIVSIWKTYSRFHDCDDLANEIGIYLVRVENLLNTIESIFNKEDDEFTIIERWETLISKNRIEESLAEMKAFFKQNQKRQYYKDTIAISQRYYAFKDSKHKDIEESGVLNQQYSKISQALLDLINRYEDEQSADA